MQIVINICKDDFEEICIQSRMVEDTGSLFGRIRKAISHCVPLPKGALITKGQAVELVEFYKLNPQHFSFDNLIDDIHNEKPIIEADRSEES